MDTLVWGSASIPAPLTNLRNLLLCVCIGLICCCFLT